MSITGWLRPSFVPSDSANFLFTLIAVCLLCVAAASTSHAATLTVAAGGSVQSALNAAQPGDTIILEAGASFVGPFTLPVKNGDAYVTIQSSQLAALPADGHRVSPADAAAMPKLLSPGLSQPAVMTAPGAHHYRFVGIEIAPTDASAFLYHLVAFGSVGAEQDTLAEVPHHLVLDRCYIHAFPTQDLIRGVMLNSGETTIQGCYIADFKSRGFDSQAIAGWNGTGPYHILNNYLEASGENVLFGGSDPSVPNLVPSDIEVRGNYFFKPLAWRGVWAVKNIFELKNARRVVIDGNVMENNWGDAQSGEAILFTVRNQNGGAPWSVVEDVQFTNNVVRHVGGGVNILGHDYFFPSQQAQRLTIKNNLFDDVDGNKWNGKGEFILMSQRAANVTFDHNTVRQSGGVAIATEGPHTGFVFTNNIAQHNQYGIYGDGTGSGNSTIDTYFPSVVLSKDVIAGADPTYYPADDFYPASFTDVGFVDLAGGNLRLRTDSQFHARATDGKDVGCDFDALNAAISGTSVVTPPPAPTPTPAPTATPTPTPVPTPTPAPTPSAGLAPWLNQDIGNVGRAGSASRSGGVITVLSAGADIWDGADSFQFVYQPLNGDGEIVMHVAGFQSANAFARVGLLIRDGLNAGARNVFFSEPSSYIPEFTYRAAANSATTYGGGAAAPARWLKLARSGDNFSASISADGVNWTLVMTKTLAMSANAYAGLAVTSHDTATLTTATLDGVAMSGSATQPPPTNSTSLALVSQSLASAIALANAPASGEAQIRALASSIEQAQAAFAAESSSFGAAAQIDRNLRFALYFSRAAAALSAAGAPTAAVQSRLSIAAARLQQAHDLMQPGGASALSGSAPSSVAATTADIGVADARSSASFAPLLAASSMGTITTSTIQSPLATTTQAIRFGAPPFELAGASVSVGGVAASLLYVSPSRIDFVVPAGIAPGNVEVIVTSQDGYVSRGSMTVAQVAPGLFTTSGDGVGAAVTLNAADLTPGAFDLTTARAFGSDKQTRVMIFATGIRAAANTNGANDVRQLDGSVTPNVAESVSVQARTSDGRIFQLPVEFAGAVGGLEGIDQLTVRLLPELNAAGSLELTISVAGQTSNHATITIR